ncbi:hypothetical protein [Halovivax gelatinilyticus]|uniref:hypothetical protein n=1 Tax=Halovivax gelatinilyticus TaxID=2961597 RepID=UPI0020CA5FAA|nr:hypothetical protein [Halovivax gelatinilyticus]
MKNIAFGINNQPLFAENADRWTSSPFTADLFTNSDEAAAAITIDEDREPVYREFLEFDGSAEFIAAFACNFDAEMRSMWCPDVSIDDEHVIFELPIGDWPDELESPRENWFVMTRWERNGNTPPEFATVKIIHPDKNSDTKTCQFDS